MHSTPRVVTSGTRCVAPMLSLLVAVRKADLVADWRASRQRAFGRTEGGAQTAGRAAERRNPKRALTFDPPARLNEGRALPCTAVLSQ